ncbi:MAG: hypothetical protein K6L74_07580 [Neptuniibacter sp.]
MLIKHIEHWVSEHDFKPTEVDCAIAVMLKIIDGKCKMPSDEKIVMATLYDHVRYQKHSLLPKDVHQLIDRTRNSQDESLKLEAYEQRVLAETVISRPVMKAFKARIRQEGLFDY